MKKAGSIHKKRIEKFKNKLQNRLKSAQFRLINEKLYTSHSSVASKNFVEDQALFDLVSALKLLFWLVPRRLSETGTKMAPKPIKPNFKLAFKA